MDKIQAYRRMCRRNALHVLHLALEDRPDADIGDGGVQWLDTYIELSRPNLAPDMQDEFIQLMGSFYGECLIEAFDGTWEVRNEALAVWTQHGFTFPFAAVRRQLQGDGSSVRARFDIGRSFHGGLSTGTAA